VIKLNWTKKKKLLVFIPLLLLSLFITAIVIIGVSPIPYDPSLEFPIEESEKIDHIRPYGVPDWSGPGTHHNGIDLVINDTVKIISPVKGTIMGITEHKNPHSENSNILFSISILINWGWTVELCIEPNFDGDDTYNNTLQRNAIKVSILQRVNVGDPIADLLYANDGSHLHYGLRGTFIGDFCAYKYSSTYARTIFDTIPMGDGFLTDPICII
jgi:hypothetical protein